MLSGWELLAALAIVLAGATIMGTVSFGLALVVAPVLLQFVEPQPAVVIVNALIATVVFFIVVQTRRYLDLRLVGGMALGGVVAVPIGVLALESASPVTLRLTIALVILCLAPLTVFNIRLPLSSHPFSGPIVGFFTSLSVTTLSIGGPLAAIYVIGQGWSTPLMRASLAFYFLLSNLVALALYTWAGLVPRDTAANIGLLIPSLIVGFGLATLAVRRMDARVFGRSSTAVIVVGGLALLGREIARL